MGFSGPAAPLLLAQTPFTAARPVLRPAAGDHLRQGLLDIYKARGSDSVSYTHLSIRATISSTLWVMW